ncbi:MAG: TIGR02452 family protein, partial [Treponema sp.]|nr:TIGR02452 family protein [Treponema sp.]
VNVITCAAPNLRERPSNGFNSGDGNRAVKISDSELEKIHIKRGRKILEAATANKNEVVILGAFGCGAFMNKPEVVANAYKKIIEEFKNAFETIEFAVYCSPRDESNFKIFSDILKQ